MIAEILPLSKLTYKGAEITFIYKKERFTLTISQDDIIYGVPSERQLQAFHELSKSELIHRMSFGKYETAKTYEAAEAILKILQSAGNL